MRTFWAPHQLILQRLLYCKELSHCTSGLARWTHCSQGERKRYPNSCSLLPSLCYALIYRLLMGYITTSLHFLMRSDMSQIMLLRSCVLTLRHLVFFTKWLILFSMYSSFVCLFIWYIWTLLSFLEIHTQVWQYHETQKKGRPFRKPLSVLHYSLHY